MKNLIYPLVFVLFFISCKKEETITSDQRRIKQTTVSNDYFYGVIKIYYNYEDDLLVNRIRTYKSNSSYNTWDTTFKVNYSYSGNVVTAIAYSGEENELSLSEKAEFEFANDRMIRMKYWEYIDDQFICQYEYFFNYNGDLLESFDYYADTANNGTLYKVSKGEYTYNGDDVTRYRIKDVYYNLYFYNEEFTYENGLMSTWISSDDYNLDNNWKNQYREEFEYNSDNLLQKVRILNWEFHWSYGYSISYFYDNGNVVKEEYSDYTNGLVYEYEYEDKPGNSDLLFYTPLDRVYKYPIVEKVHNTSLNAGFEYIKLR
jgi:hypothetical protein